MPFSISDGAEGTAILRLDEAEPWDLTEPVQGLLDAGRQRFVIDLAGTDFLNSVRIASIIQAHHQVTGHGAQLHVANLEPGLRQIFAILKLDRLFALDLDLDAAIDGFHD